MTQHTAFGAASLITYLKVEKKDGRIVYYKVSEEKTTEIDKETYYKEGGY